jgi:hypothetical protein
MLRLKLRQYVTALHPLQTFVVLCHLRFSYNRGRLEGNDRKLNITEKVNEGSDMADVNMHGRYGKCT